VYSRSQVPDVALPAGRAARIDPGAARSLPAADVLLLKLSLLFA
jgi:hypothetical protein